MTTTLELKFESSNAAFDEDPVIETTRILGDLIQSISDCHYSEGDLVDINGNTVGSFKFEVTK